jgi:hypothetical protein
MASLISVGPQLMRLYHMFGLIAIYFDELGHVAPLELTNLGHSAYYLDSNYSLGDKNLVQQFKLLNLEELMDRNLLLLFSHID